MGQAQPLRIKGGSITPPAIQAITEMIGNDLWTLDRELEKAVPLRYWP